MFKNPRNMFGRHIDRFFSALPFAFIIYHALNFFNDSTHMNILFQIIINYCLSCVLKHIFKSSRRFKTYEFKEWSIINRLKFMKSHYSFPSSHAMFFTKYYLLYPNIAILFLCTCGIISRLIYQHHTLPEIAIGVACVLMIEISIYLLYHYNTYIK